MVSAFLEHHFLQIVGEQFLFTITGRFGEKIVYTECVSVYRIEKKHSEKLYCLRMALSQRILFRDNFVLKTGSAL